MSSIDTSSELYIVVSEAGRKSRWLETIRIVLKPPTSPKMDMGQNLDLCEGASESRKLCDCKSTMGVSSAS